MLKSPPVNHVGVETSKKRGWWECLREMAPKAAGVSHNRPRAQTCTFKGPGASQTPPNFNEKTPREREKERKWGREREKKREILGGPAVWGPAEGGPGRGSRAGGPAQGVSGGGNEKNQQI